jgi:pentatricopeptide repeat protein
MLDYWKKMKEEGLKANIVTYGVVISRLAKAGEHALAVRFYDELHKESMTPNAVIYGAMLDVHSIKGDMDAALQIWQTMSTRSIRKDVLVSLRKT